MSEPGTGPGVFVIGSSSRHPTITPRRGDVQALVFGKVLTCAVVGLDGALVEVEADIGMGLHALTVVGLPDAAVQESRERVRAAIKNSGCVFPLRRFTVNLAPADLK